VRDCLSLLDQAIAHAGGRIEAENVRQMLGLADRARSIDLFEALMAGQIEASLRILREQVDAGADPATVIADLANLTHLVTRLKVVPAAAQDPSLTPDERDRGAALAGKLGLRVLARAWQILLKGYEEAHAAPDSLAAAEMILIRLAHASDLPTPDEIIEKLQNAPAPSNGGGRSLPSSPSRGGYGQAAPRLSPAPGSASPAPANDRPPELRAFTDIVALAGRQRDLILKHALESQLSPVSVEPGRLEVALAPGADPQIIQTLAARLKAWTGKPWLVTVSSRPATPTLREQRVAAEAATLNAAHEDPLVQKVLSTFPGSRIVAVRRRGEAAPGEESVPEPDFEAPNPEDEEDYI
jgi:DNA polymerase-3 subunit gamma/tau